MLTLHYFLDTRASGDGPAPLKLGIGKRSATAYLRTEFRLLPANWDAKAQRIVGLPRSRQMNDALARIRNDVQDFLRPLLYAGELADLSATEIKNLVDEHLNGQREEGISLGELWDAMMGRKSEQTQRTYRTARERVERADSGLFSRPARKIREKDALALFEALTREGMSEAYRNIAAQGFKVVYNDGIRAGLVESNPFAAVKISYVRTKKRDLTLEQIRALWRAVPELPSEREALDLFKLSFLLRAANAADIRKMTPADIFNGRIEYTRSKTGKQYSVRIEPEAREILDRYADGKHLFAPLNRYRSMHNAEPNLNKYLKRVAERAGLPDISLYWARHTFASLAFELGTPVEIVSAMLGHSVGARVTMGYVDIREKQVDDAARKVYDAVTK